MSKRDDAQAPYLKLWQIAAAGGGELIDPTLMTFLEAFHESEAHIKAQDAKIEALEESLVAMKAERDGRAEP